MKGTVVTGGPHAIPGWEISGFIEYIKSGQKQGDMLLTVPEGDHAVRLGNDASIKQKIKVIKGMYYAVTFVVARTCAQQEQLNVSVTPDWVVLPMQTLYSSNGWDAYAWSFLAESSPEVEMVIHNPGVEEDPACGPLIDSIALKPLYPPRLTNIPQGKRAVELIAGKESAIAQVARTIAGKTYVLSFTVGDAGNSCEGSLGVEAFAAKERIELSYESKGKGGFKRATLKFVADSTRTRIVFISTAYTMRSDDHSSLCGPVVDDVKLLSLRKLL
ncbi:Galactose-binding-like domain superfamily [Sesbania bispinosa]|nr:Galactose-binding-like domain superfamily [Sesbania bispinosa]